MPLDLENLGLLGGGGEGRVFLTRDRASGRLLALKLVRADDPRAFLDAAARRSTGEPDPPLLEPIDAGEVGAAPAGVARALPARSGGGWVWLAYPYVDGPNVLELCDRAAAWGAAETAAVLVQLFARLARLHPSRAHGDVKPENLLADRGGALFLADLLAPGRHGTPYYRAEGVAGPAADVHAACALGHVLWSRRFPRPGERGLPDLPEPERGLVPERRSAEHELARLLREGAAEGRPDAAAALSRLRRLAPPLGVDDAPAALRAVMERWRVPERLAALERLGLEQAPASRSLARAAGEGARALADGQAGPAAERAPSAARGRGWGERPGSPRRVAWQALVVGTLAAAAVRALWPPAAPGDPLPGAATVLPPSVFDPRIHRAARLTEIRCGGSVDASHAYFKLAVAEPILHVAVAGGEGAVLWSREHPGQGELHCFDLAPGSYLFEQLRADDQGRGAAPVRDDRELTLARGEVLARETHRRAQFAPAP